MLSLRQISKTEIRLPKYTIMNFLTNEKLTIVGAAGMIGSNMAQTALMMKLTPNICLYDPFGPALEGVAEELFHKRKIENGSC